MIGAGIANTAADVVVDGGVGGDGGSGGSGRNGSRKNGGSGRREGRAMRGRERQQHACQVPGCRGAGLYACMSPDSNHWFCRRHKCRKCLRIPAAADSAPDMLDAAAAGGGERRLRAQDTAQISDLARRALSVVRGRTDQASLRMAYALKSIIEICGARPGDLRACACAHSELSHGLCTGKCSECTCGAFSAAAPANGCSAP